MLARPGEGPRVSRCRSPRSPGRHRDLDVPEQAQPRLLGEDAVGVDGHNGHRLLAYADDVLDARQARDRIGGQANALENHTLNVCRVTVRKRHEPYGSFGCAVARWRQTGQKPARVSTAGLRELCAFESYGRGRRRPPLRVCHRNGEACSEQTCKEDGDEHPG